MTPYDPTLYEGAAPYYARGRPPYSRELVATVTRELGLDGTGRLLDVGCGPGMLTVELAPSFTEAIGLDPDAAMLVEGERRAREAGIDSIRWVEALAEDIPTLTLGPCRLVTFGQSYQWTDQVAVGQAVYDLLEPGGAIALVVHTVEGRLQPEGPGHPPIPHREIRALIRTYLGPRRRAGQGFTPDFDRYADALARTRFGAPHSVFAPGRPDIVRDVDGVIAGVLSTSYAAPHLFGDQLDAFEADMRALLTEHSPDGLFWDWPGDTEILLAGKPT